MRGGRGNIIRYFGLGVYTFKAEDVPSCILLQINFDILPLTE